MHALPLSKRPRERLRQLGASALALRELLAALIHTGTRGSGLGAGAGGDWDALAVADALIAAFGWLPGIAQARAVALKAAFELGRRATLASNEARAGAQPRRRWRVKRPSLVSGAQIAWDDNAWTIVNAGVEQVVLKANGDGACQTLSRQAFEAFVTAGAIQAPESEASAIDQEVREILTRASMADLASASARLRTLQDDPGKTPARTMREWRRRYEQARMRYGSGFIGLIPRLKMSGNTKRKLPADVVAVMDEVIEVHYDMPRRKRASAVYGELLLRCQEQGLRTPSRKSFRRALKAGRTQARQIAREGKRSAYKTQPFYWELERGTPRHGCRQPGWMVVYPSTLKTYARAGLKRGAMLSYLAWRQAKQECGY